MKDFLTAFMMAWGNFLAIPCPKKVWRQELKKEMLTMLPIIGLVTGFLAFLISYVLCSLHIPISVTAFFMTLYTFAISGFMHADGFMDCCDAILSRRDLAERQRILKDSRVGAFAVISMILMALGTFAAFIAIQEILLSYSVTISYTVSRRILPIVAALPLIMIPVMSRATAGSCVLGMRPLKSSQYADAENEETHIGERGAERHANNLKYMNTIMIGALCILLIVVLVLFVLSVKISAKATLIMLVRLLIPTVVTLLATRFFAGLARRNLGGMSGDIAGFSICMGELVGLIVMALVLHRLI